MNFGTITSAWWTRIKKREPNNSSGITPTTLHMPPGIWTNGTTSNGTLATWTPDMSDTFSPLCSRSNRNSIRMHLKTSNGPVSRFHQRFPACLENRTTELTNRSRSFSFWKNSKRSLSTRGAWLKRRKTIYTNVGSIEPSQFLSLILKLIRWPLTSDVWSSRKKMRSTISFSLPKWHRMLRTKN